MVKVASLLNPRYNRQIFSAKNWPDLASLCIFCSLILEEQKNYTRVSLILDLHCKEHLTKSPYRMIIVIERRYIEITFYSYEFAPLLANGSKNFA